MDEIDSGGETVGQRPRAAREAQKMTLEALAAQTRIPVRHLASLEESEWDSLPAPAYCVGFAKNYAALVGLDRAEIADQLRAEMGGTRQTYAQTDVFEPADPKRTMPKWLILGAVVGVIVLLLALNWMRQRELEPSAPSATTTDSAPPPATTRQTPPSPAPTAVASGAVTITALQDAWIKVRDRNGAALREALLKQGETFDVPPGAAAPVLDTGRPEALRITVGGRDVPAIGVPGHSVAGVSLLATDLMRGPAIAETAANPRKTAPAVRRAVAKQTNASTINTTNATANSE
ncbi:MAG: DUF4115 domain-containing protein [Sphingomonadales bacterium]|nr:DUF4115 domain-containing protein [Sphingomonadales bacterium]